jgi:predicted transcriptional regulator
MCATCSPCAATPSNRTSESTTLTVRLSNRTKERLADLDGRTRRTRSFLAAEAISDYVERELAIIEAARTAR